MKTVLAEVTVADKVWKYVGLNEIVIRSGRSQAVHLDISIGKNFIERFSGDGLLVCTAAGSTAYNYALGGSIIDPRLSLLQITPIAPMNTTAFRSFTSSLAVPPDLPIKIQPEPGRWQSLLVVADNNSYSYPKIDEVNLGYSPYEVRLLRFENYDFWSKVKSKFL
jgi:NAD+ kinase